MKRPKLEHRLLKSVDPSVAKQVDTRAKINALPLSAATAELALKAKLDLHHRS